MKTMEMKFCRFEVKASNDEERTIEGLASTVDLDGGMDVVHSGAFSRTLDHAASSKRVIPLIDQHNYGSVRSVVGKMVEAKETEDGLVTKFQIIDGPDGDEIYRRVKGGYIDGLSIGYDPVKFDFEDNEETGRRIRHIRELKLFEVSVVIWPMNDNARVEQVKALRQRLTALKTAEMTEEGRKELEELEEEIRALREEDTPGLAPEDPKRLAMEEALRDLELRSLASR